MLLSASTTSGECSIDHEFQALLTLSSLLATFVKVNSAFNNVTAYMCKSQAIILAICI